MRRHLPEIAIIVASVALFLVAFLFWQSTKMFTSKEVTDAIQQNRIVLTKAACRQRNQDRAGIRANLEQNKRTLAGVQESALKQYGLTRQEALDQLNTQIARVRPLDCRKAVQRVVNAKSASRPRSSTKSPALARRQKKGGGQGPRRAPRPSRQRRRRAQSPDQPSSPPATTPQQPEQQPAPGGGGGSAPSGGGGGSGGGGVGPVKTPEAPNVTTPQLPLVPPVVVCSPLVNLNCPS